MIVVPERPRHGMAQRIAAALGLDINMIAADSFRLEPFGENWIVRWDGVAVMTNEGVAALVAETHDSEAGR